ncbi:unnamed protein product [Ostreobium quekettii]|uniref:Uncharacterized protein n=1 Tax=Ostreobium quekettii TaxID=121088 RepID=A0A8S1ITV0_9CHLO|nr:unnamed protein product [Ostreobium quekettii]
MAHRPGQLSSSKSVSNFRQERTCRACRPPGPKSLPAGRARRGQGPTLPLKPPPTHPPVRSRTPAMALRALPGGSSLLRRLGSSACASPHHARSAMLVKQSLADAVEQVAYIGASAEQAYLEADPACREPRAEYLRRYQSMAWRALAGALDEYHEMREAVGEERMQELQGAAQMEGLLAGALAAKFRLRRQMAEIREGDEG